MDIKNIKEVLTKIFVTFPDQLRDRIGQDKITHGLMGLYILSYGKWFGPLGAAFAAITAVLFSFIREKLSPNPDYNDVKWTAYFCFADLLIFIVFSMILDVVFGIELRFC